MRAYTARVPFLNRDRARAASHQAGISRRRRRRLVVKWRIAPRFSTLVPLPPANLSGLFSRWVKARALITVLRNGCVYFSSEMTRGGTCLEKPVEAFAGWVSRWM